MKEGYLFESQYDSDRLKVTRLRGDLEQARASQAAAEADLGERKAEIRSLERRIRIRLGRLVDTLAALDEEIKGFEEELARKVSPLDVNAGYLPVEEQYRRVWQTTPQSAIEQPETISTGTHFDLTDEKQVKRLYRQLARRYHPDLAQDRDEIQFRTRKMAALNEAYASRRISELAALASEAEPGPLDQRGTDKTAAETIPLLEKALSQVLQRIDLIQKEIQELQNSPVVRLSLETKLAQQAGRDLLGEMAKNLKYSIHIKQIERDRLKARLDQIEG